MTMWRGTRTTREALIGGATSHRMRIDRTLAEKSGKAQGRAKEWTPDAIKWSIAVERLMLSENAGVTVGQEISDLAAGTVVQAVVLLGLDYYEGTARIVSVETGSPYKGSATARVNLEGTGPLTRTMPDNVALDYMLPFGVEEDGQE